jgi:hypothetical protein
MSVATELKQKTNGLINMFKTGSFANTALSLFESLTRGLDIDPILQDEAEFISNASFASMISADVYKGPGYKYDVTSMYPSILASVNFLIPLKRGQFQIMSQQDFDKLEYYSQGIFRCKVNESDHKLINKYQFRFNSKNYYTQVDLTKAKELGLKVDLIMDGQPNYLMYDRNDCINGSQLFKPYVELLFKLKKQGVTGAKELLNVLWGKLTQKDILNVIINEDEEDEVVEIHNDKTVTKITPLSDTRTMVHFVRDNGYYMTPYARLGPFLLAKGRYNITKIMKPFINQIHRVHTDGFICEKQLDIKIGNNLGDLKYEGYCPQVEIKNNIRIIGEFKI